MTSGAARLLGVDEERGSIAAGMIADMIVVKGDPRKNLDHLRTPSFVVLRGRLLRRNDLDTLIEALIERVDKIKLAAAAPIEMPPLELPEGEVLLEGIVDNSAHGQRLSAERFAVVKAADGSLTYIGRLLTPGSATYAETVLETRQRLVGNHLEDFEVNITFGPKSSCELKGTRIAGNMRLRQTLNQPNQPPQSQNIPIQQEVSFLDLGSVTSSLILAKHQPPGKFFALYLENLSPAIGTWTMAPAENFGYFVQTHQGAASLQLDARGVPVAINRVQGTTVIETTAREISPESGAGLALPKRKVATKE